MTRRNPREAGQTGAGEEWRDVVGYEGMYKVSNLGRVWSLTRMVPSCNGRTRVQRGRLLSPGTKRSGHLHVSLRDGVTARSFHVHSLVLSAFVGPRPDGADTRHINGNPRDNRLVNLCYGTRSENVQDAYAHGSVETGAGHFNSSLPMETAEAIRAAYAAGGVTQRQVAAMFGVSQMTVSRVVRNKSYRGEA